MFPLVPPYVSPYLIVDLDAQLTRLHCCACHVAAGPVLVGIGWNSPTIVPLDHGELDSYLQAELIAQRVNGLQGTTDGERSRILAQLVPA